MLRRFTESLQQMMEAGSGATNADALRLLHDSKVILLDPRILSYLDLPPQNEAEGGDNPAATEEDDDGEDLTREVAAMDAFLACPASQFWGYYS